MRTVYFPGPQFKDANAVLNGILWATSRRGTHKWESESVPATIQRYLLERGADNDLYNLGRVKYLLKKLADHGYATKTLKGRRIVKFEFAGDVDLRPTELPKFVGSKKDKEVEAKVEQVESTSFGTTVSFDDTDEGLPIPVVTPPPPPRYRAEDLDIRLDKFAQQDGDLYASYADKLIAALDNLIVE